LVKFLLDENLSSNHAVALKQRGYDDDAIVESGLSGASDPDVRGVWV
jgi:predicted nuclease of predicted toxin-antitoxin system